MTKVTKAYISGPMTGLPDFNFPAFNEAAIVLQKEGYSVFNPAENDGGDTSHPWEYYMRKDIQAVCDADIVFVLPGWRASKGASLEVMVAERLNVPIRDFMTREEIKETILETAQRLVGGDRRASYGHPLDDYINVAALWSAYLQGKLKHNITYQEAIAMMVLLKLNREHNHPKEDNRIDAAGYIHCLDLALAEDEYRKGMTQ